MSSIAFGLVIFALLSGVALATLYLHPRLPERQLSKETQDSVKVGVGLVVVLSALVLGLLTASVKNSFDTANRDLKRFSTQLVLLDRTMRAYGPQATSGRNVLEHYVERALALTWPTDDRSPVVEDPAAEQLMDQVQDAILSLAPESNRQRALSDELKGGIRRLIEQRWTLIEESAGSLNLAFLAVLVIWLMLIFASFGYNAPRNGLVAVTFVLCAASIAIALFLIVEMDRPFDGLIKISPAPLQTALAHLRE